MNILIVEPDALLGRLYRELLHHEGHEVWLSPTAQGAIHAADEHKPDLVLLEMQLVSHSGVEFLYEFRSYGDWADIPVVVISQVPPAEFSASRDILYEELGVQAYHYKPRTSLAQLRHIVAAFSRRNRQQAAEI